MGKKKGGGDVNAGPGQKAKAQKAASRAEKDAKNAAASKAKEEAEWSAGANSKKKQREREQAEKEAAKLAAKEAKKAAELADELEIANMRSTKKKAAKKSGKKKKNDLSMLDAFLDDEKKEKKAKEKKKAGFSSSKTDDLLKPNMNRVNAEESAKGNVSATGIDNALSALSVDDKDKTKAPSRKALYAAFEEREMPRLREEYPGLKLSQLKDKLWKEWQKAPENPQNATE